MTSSGTHGWQAFPSFLLLLVPWGAGRRRRGIPHRGRSPLEAGGARRRRGSSSPSHSSDGEGLERARAAGGGLSHPAPAVHRARPKLHAAPGGPPAVCMSWSSRSRRRAVLLFRGHRAVSPGAGNRGPVAGYAGSTTYLKSSWDGGARLFTGFARRPLRPGGQQRGPSKPGIPTTVSSPRRVSHFFRGAPSLLLPIRKAVSAGARSGARDLVRPKNGTTPRPRVTVPLAAIKSLRAPSPGRGARLSSRLGLLTSAWTIPVVRRERVLDERQGEIKWFRHGRRSLLFPPAASLSRAVRRAG